MGRSRGGAGAVEGGGEGLGRGRGGEEKSTKGRGGEEKGREERGEGRGEEGKEGGNV